MSLTMIATSPFHRMKQCLAKIERKRGALKENIYRLRKDRINLERLLDNKQEILDKLTELSPNIISTTTELTTEISSNSRDFKNLNWALQELEIDIEEKVANIYDSNIYIEAALKEIGHYQTAYEQIKKNYQIPDDWDEKDFEEGEVEEHIKMAFLHAVRDVTMTGRLNVGTHE